MKIQALSENFKRGVFVAEKVISKNTTLPILSNVLLEAEKGRFKVSSTNLEIGVVCLLRAKIEKEGKIAIPGRVIGSYLSSLPDGEKLNIEAQNQMLNLVSSGGRATIKGIDPKDFPIIPKPSSDSLLEIDSQIFQESILKVSVCAAIAETRQELTGIYVEFGKDKLTFASTDSFRLAESVISLQKGAPSSGYQKFISRNRSIIVPARTLQEVIRSISPESGKLKIYMGESQIFFEVDGTLFVSRIIDGKYPEYKQVIPKSFASSMRVNREDFLRAARTASIFADSKSREVRIKIKGGEKRVKVESQSVETGENITEVDAQINTKGENSVAFNNRYLVDALNSLISSEAEVGFNDNFGPVIFREINDDKPSEKHLHIVMPIRS